MRSFRAIHPLLLLALFLAVAFVLYHGSFGAPVYYDSVFIFDNEQKFAFEGLRGTLKIYPERPVSMASFHVNYLLWGLDPYYFRAVNAAVLAVTAFMVSLVTLFLFRTPALSEKSGASGVELGAMFAGLVFLVHPVQAFVVLFIWQRPVIMAALFYVAALAAYLATREGRSGQPRYGYLAVYALFALSVFSKEFAVTLPAVLLLVEIGFFRERAKNLCIRALAYAGVTAPLLLVRSLLEPSKVIAETSSGILTTIATYYEMSGLTLIDTLITQCRSLFSYAALVIAPLPSSLQLITPRVVYRSFLDTPAAVASVIGAILLVALGLWLLRKRPLTGFGILFFVVTLIPESILVPQYLFCVYRVTLPMVGLLLIAVDWIVTGLDYSRSHRGSLLLKGSVAALALLVVVSLVLVTRGKARSWHDPLSFWSAVVKHMPAQEEDVESRGSADALNFLGVALQKTGRAKEAIDLHQRASRSDPMRIWTYLYMAKAHMRLGQLREAEAALKEALRLNPKEAEAHMGLALVLSDGNRHAEALKSAEKAIELAPHNPKYHNDMGSLLMDSGNLDRARLHFMRATELNPNFALAYRNLGRTFMELGNNEKAAQNLRKACLLRPGDVLARSDLGVTMFRMGRLDDAEALFVQALKLDPKNRHVEANLMAVRRAKQETEQR